MSCPDATLDGCSFAQFLVNQTPRFDELIMSDIRPTDGWLLNVSTGTAEMGTPAEVTQDRFRVVYPNINKPWSKVSTAGAGCSGSPCDPTEHQIGWGADRLTYYAEQQTWATPLLCYDQNMHVTHAEQHIDQIINDILRPATVTIHSNYLRRRHLLWSKGKYAANKNLGAFTYEWSLDTNGDESYFDCSVPPTSIFKLVPQMLQRRFQPLMMQGYAGKNPFKDTSPFIELVTDMDTCWDLDHIGGQGGVGGGDNPNVLGNWRFQDFSETGKYWRYGFNGQIGNFMVRVDPGQIRMNYIADLGAGAHSGNGNRYRYQVVLPYKNNITTGAGGAAGLGDDVNPDYLNAQICLSQIHHKNGMELLVPDAKPLNPDMPFGHRDFGGKWRFLMHDLGVDTNGNAISNKWENKGQFGAWFKNYVRPKHYEFLEVFLHKREQFQIPEIAPIADDPGYPAQIYRSTLPSCPLPAEADALYGTGVPTGTQDGPVPTATAAAATPDL